MEAITMINSAQLLLLCILLANLSLAKPQSQQMQQQVTAAGGLIQLQQQYQQHNNILHFTVFENAPIGTYLGTIRSADGQIPTLILPSTTPEADRLAALYVNLTNGDLTTNSILDREHREQYGFVAMVTQPMAEIKCTVTVRDTNDNAPMFIMPSNNETNFVIDMPEGQRGVRKLLPLAVDYDSPQYGIKEFRIVSGNTPSGTFQLVEHEAPARSSLQQVNSLADDASSLSAAVGADNPQIMQQLAQQVTVLIPSQPVMQSPAQMLQHQLLQQQTQQQQQQSATSSSQTAAAAANAVAAAQNMSPHSRYYIDLEVNQILDRENQSSYQLVVEALDGGQPPLMGRLMVTVNVQDINDNDPVFTRKLYEAHFKEDTAKGTILLRVQAHDADLDANGQITYLIKRHSSNNQSTGSNQASDNNNDATRYLPTSSNNAQQANNNNNKQQRQQQSATAAALTNGQQQPAAAKQQMRQQNGANDIHEQQDASSNIPTATSNSNYSKLKIPSNSYSTSSSSPPSPSQLFEIDPIKGEIHLVHQLDYETDQVHELLIEARDHGKPSRSAYAIVKVFVLDVNDDLAPAARIDEKKQQYNNSPTSEFSRASEMLSGGRLGVGGSNGGSENFDASQNPWTILNLTNWFAQLNSPVLFVIVLVALLSLLFPLCLVKIRSHQPESDYNDTAGLTLTSNNGLTKQSPNHSTSNEHSNGSNDNHHRHHDHQRRANGSYTGLNGLDGSGFVSPNGKSRYQYSDSSNLYHNPYPPLSQTRHVSNHHHQQMPPDSPSNHQMATGGGSAGGTMTLHNHPGLLSSPGGHHSLEHHHRHHHQFSSTGVGHHSNSLTYAHHHSRAAQLHATSGSTMDCSAAGAVAMPTPALSLQQPDRWLDSGLSSQAPYVPDWCGSYNWDYLSDWVPEYHTIIPLLQHNDALIHYQNY